MATYDGQTWLSAADYGDQASLYPPLSGSRYQMVGTLTAGLTKIYWQSIGNPDPTGAGCPGHVPGDFVAGSICWISRQFGIIG
jgi:hypothetical protein